MKRIFPLILMIFLSVSCDKGGGESDRFYIEIEESMLNLNRLAANRTLKVDTNIEGIECKVSSLGWCEALYDNGILTVTVTGNEGSDSRTAMIYLEGEKIRQTLTVTQTGRGASAGDIKDDVKISISGATASSFQNGEGIEKSYDGSLSTLYHSHWTQTEMPVTLVYNFTANVGTMDYLVYNPRSDGGTNGNFGEFDLYVATAANPELTLYGNYNFNGNGSAAIISFSPALQNPTRIQFVVNSGSGGFVSCAEMQFFRKTAGSFDFSAIFTDITCSELKPGIGKADIENIQNQFYQELAMEIFNGDYNTEFRVQDYKAWQHPGVMAAINKTNTYSLRDNPTGIYVRKGDELVALAGDLHGQSVALFVQNPTKMIQGSSYPLSTGANKFKAANDGLIYVMYHTPTGTEQSVKINIVTGRVNGYFDSAKHTKEEWASLLAGATFERFDLVGKYAHLTFETDKFKQYTTDGVALIDKYDEMVWMEQDFMGLFKYDRAFRNRLYFVVMSGSSYMHASSYYTGYDVSTQNTLLDLSALTKNPWGPAHEVGHVNQTRPGFKWRGMTEVSNNVHSMYIQTSWGNTSRLVADGKYSKAFKEIIDANICYNAHSDVFCKLVPFWQLKLYMHDVLEEKDFYKDVYETIRVNPNPPTDGDCQTEFVKIVCDVAKLDLTEFFEAWGFFTPISIEIDDYGKGMFTVTQAMVDAAKASIAAKNYPKPAHKVQDITDSNVSGFIK